ncbi:uncharacterized protein LOC119121673 [Syngnathus acus]|uniref:uncharacterized protein LOC119121626 n=1 Tax=Syngnathus acus TaxID=161584 RepID=UPI001885E09B|nr:uncharacterized protein LOC119121626 [Syngnathus acus]XP_037105438.1 uncharacterized protein LOC119121673 [Syngnathus acus]
MNFSKLLCLVLVYSEQFGQVLATVQTGKDCKGTADATVTCKRKKDETVKLTIAGTANNPVRWKKGTTTISAQAAKYELDGDKNKILTILNLKEGDEETYTAEGTSPVEKFQVQVVDCLGGKSTKPAGLCQGKPGGSIRLGLSDATGSSLSWMKDGTAITTGDKYDGPVNAATLKIKDLDDGDEKEFTGGITGAMEKFIVQVADCFGDTGTVQCQGKLNEALKLRISAAVSGTVTWEKVDGQLPSNNQKVGTNNVGLKLAPLTAADAGTYKATYDSKDVSFTVRIPGEFDVAGRSTHWYESRKALTRKHFAFHWQWKPTNKQAHSAALFVLQTALAVLRAKVCDTGAGGGDTKKESTENGKDNSGGGGGGGGGSSNSGTDQVNLGEGKGTGKGAGDHGGGGGGLSYSPALLVTVTLVHLLLQLAA